MRHLTDDVELWLYIFASERSSSLASLVILNSGKAVLGDSGVLLDFSSDNRFGVKTLWLFSTTSRKTPASNSDYGITLVYYKGHTHLLLFT